MSPPVGSNASITIHELTPTITKTTIGEIEVYETLSTAANSQLGTTATVWYDAQSTLSRSESISAVSTTEKESSLGDGVKSGWDEEEVKLHPADEGFHAWLFVFCAFILETLIWGFGFSYGVFQDWYIEHEFKGSSKAAINSVGMVAVALEYSEGLILLVFMKWYGQHLRKLMVVSLGLCVASMFASSFATEVWQLILLQGVFYGVGAGFLYGPVICWLTQWFDARRSLAAGLIFGGTGLGGAIFPVMVTYLLENVGFRWTLRIWSLILLVLGGLAMLGMKPRLPFSYAAKVKSELAGHWDLSFLKQPLFLSVGSAVFLQGLAYFIVILYIPAYATALGYSRIQGTIALSVFNLASVVGQVVSGWYCDIRPFTNVMIFSGVLSSVLAWGLWGFAHSLGMLYAFVITFALISGALSSTSSPASAAVAVAQPSLVWFCFAIVKGTSSITGPLIAAGLHPSDFIPSSGSHPGTSHWGGNGFTSITIFVGCTTAASAVMSIVSAVIRQRSTTKA
ncbi:MFS general substrate transporter [Clavulina sp. PMI_390]|nr:MFS general substrate transporter [Clavulina sp. PMI_390]